MTDQLDLNNLAREIKQIEDRLTVLENAVSDRSSETLDPVYDMMLQQLRSLVALSGRHDNPDVMSELTEQMLEIAQFLTKCKGVKKC